MKMYPVILATLAHSFLASTALAQEPTALQTILSSRDNWFKVLDQKVIGAYPSPNSWGAEQDRLASIKYTGMIGERLALANADKDESTAYLYSTFAKSALGTYSDKNDLSKNAYYTNAYNYIYRATYATDPNKGTNRSLDFILKDKYQRGRPYQVLDTNGQYIKDYQTITGSSYPSGHTWKGYRQAIALGFLFPERGDEIFSRALQFGESRVIVNAHFPTDTIASRIGTYYTMAQMLSDDTITAEIAANAIALRQSMDPLCEGDMRQCLEQEDRPVYDAHSANNFEIGYYGSRQGSNISPLDPEKLNIQTGALLRLRFPYLKAEDWRDIIAGTVYPEDSLAGWSIETGNDMSYWGLINLPAAYNGPSYLYRDMNVDQKQDTENDIAGFGKWDIWKNNISGPGHLTKNGDGTLVLNGDNSFGGFSLNEGSLILNGSNDLSTNSEVSGGELMMNGQLSSPLTVHDTGRVSGTGTLSNVVMKSGSVLAPGNTTATGTLHITGNLSLENGAALEYRFGKANVAGGPENDLTTIGGNLTLDGTIHVNTLSTGAFAPGIYRIFNYGGSLVDNGLNLGAMPDETKITVQTSVKGEVNLVNSYGMILNFWDGEGESNDNAITGGSGVWQAGSVTDHWTTETGTMNSSFEDASFAIFTGKSGTVTVDKSKGDIVVTGMQFASDGYHLKGDEIHFSGDENLIRVSTGSVTIENDLIGQGQFTKTDQGTLILTGQNNFAQGNVVESGRLIVNGSLAGNLMLKQLTYLGGTGYLGHVTVAENATLSPGQSIGTLTAQQINFEKGSHFNVEIDGAGRSDQLNITGQAFINGGNVNIEAEKGFYKANTQYTIIKTQQGIVRNADGSGFETVNSNLAYLTPSLHYDDKNVYLNMERNDISLCLADSTRNQCSTAKAIESMDLQNPIYEALLNLSRDKANPAFDNLSGEIYGSGRSALLTNSHYLRDAINQRILSDNRLPSSEPVWFTTWAHSVDMKGSNNTDSIDNKGWGLALGLDGEITNNIFAGFVLGYERTEVDGSRNSNLDVDAFHLGAYAATELNRVKLRGGLAYSYLDSESERNIWVRGLESKAKDSLNGWQVQMFGEASTDMKLNDKAIISPYANLAHVWLDLGDINEKGSLAALESDSDTQSVTFTTVGIRGNMKLPTATNASFFSDIGWSHAFGDIDGKTRQRFSAGSNDFTVAGTPVGEDSAVIGAGLQVQFSTSSNVALAYRGQLSDKAKDHSANLTWKINF